MNSLQLLDLAKSFWQSVARPLAELSAAVVVIVFALGIDQSGWLNPSMNIPLVPGADSDTARALALYGLDKIVPAALALMLLVAAQAASRVLTTLGSFLPGHLSPNRAAILAQNCQNLQLRQLLATHPGVNDLEALNVAIDSAVAGKVERDIKVDAVQVARFADTSAETLAAFVKGLAVFALVLAIASRVLLHRDLLLGRLAFIGLAAVVILLCTTLWRMSARSTEAREKVRLYLYWLQQQPDGVSKLGANGTEHDEKIRDASNARTWTFRWTLADGKAVREVACLAQDMLKVGAKQPVARAQVR